MAIARPARPEPRGMVQAEPGNERGMTLIKLLRFLQVTDQPGKPY